MKISTKKVATGLQSKSISTKIICTSKVYTRVYIFNLSHSAFSSAAYCILFCVVHFVQKEDYSTNTCMYIHTQQVADAHCLHPDWFVQGFQPLKLKYNNHLVQVKNIIYTMPACMNVRAQYTSVLCVMQSCMNPLCAPLEFREFAAAAYVPDASSYCL